MEKNRAAKSFIDVLFTKYDQIKNDEMVGANSTDEKFEKNIQL
jgi:hypothetical protein